MIAARTMGYRKFPMPCKTRPMTSRCVRTEKRTTAEQVAIVYATQGVLRLFLLNGFIAWTLPMCDYRSGGRKPLIPRLIHDPVIALPDDPVFLFFTDPVQV